MTRTLLTTLLGLSLIVSGAIAQTATPDPQLTVNQRLENQKHRIQSGNIDDQLTKAEATRLRADDAAVRAQEKVYRNANDGTLTNGEKKQLNRELSRSSRQIFLRAPQQSEAQVVASVIPDNHRHRRLITARGE